MSNPYSNAKDYQFWRRAVASRASHTINPVVTPKFMLNRDTVVSTAGSCFAQHISNRLKRLGFNYYVPESGGDRSPEEKARLNYGVFSARYGNIYTTRQLIQLVEEAYGERTPAEQAWIRKDGRYVDPYRPLVEPDGYATPDDVIAARNLHLESVRKIIERSEVFIFTLGLTEMWESKADGSAFPLAPGISGGEYDPEKYSFRNLTFSEVITDLEAFISKAREINPDLKILLTVSPVPLIATYEERNVLVSTAYSKAVLRAVAGEISDKYDFIDYFPSYEIITGTPTGGLYYEDDLREVNAFGVSHAMCCFIGNYLPKSQVNKSLSSDFNEALNAIVCDESELEHARQ